MSNETIYSIAKNFGLKPSDILGSSRKQNVVVARNLVCLVMSRRDKRSSTQIGKKLNGRDHTTILHSLKMAEISIARSKWVADIFEEEMASAPYRFFNVPASEDQAHPPIIPEEPRHPCVLKKRIKPKNEHAQNDANARMIMHGTFALMRAIESGDCGKNIDLIWSNDSRALASQMLSY